METALHSDCSQGVGVLAQVAGQTARSWAVHCGDGLYENDERISNQKPTFGTKALTLSKSH